MQPANTGKATSGWNHKGESTDTVHRDGVTRKSEEVSVMEMEQRGYVIQQYSKDNFKKGGPYE